MPLIPWTSRRRTNNHYLTWYEAMKNGSWFYHHVAFHALSAISESHKLYMGYLFYVTHIYIWQQLLSLCFWGKKQLAKYRRHWEMEERLPYFKELSILNWKARYNQKLAKAGLKYDSYVLRKMIYGPKSPILYLRWHGTTCACTWYLHPVNIPKWKWKCVIYSLVCQN